MLAELRAGRVRPWLQGKYPASTAAVRAELLPDGATLASRDALGHLGRGVRYGSGIPQPVSTTAMAGTEGRAALRGRVKERDLAIAADVIQWPRSSARLARQVALTCVRQQKNVIIPLVVREEVLTRASHDNAGLPLSSSSRTEDVARRDACELRARCPPHDFLQHRVRVDILNHRDGRGEHSVCPLSPSVVAAGSRPPRDANHARGHDCALDDRL